MPKANTPQEVSRLIGEAISAGDLDAALSLFEPDATFVMLSAFGGGTVTGLANLREAFGGFLAIDPKLTINPENTFVADDTALLVGSWTLTGRDADGNPIDLAGRHADVVRRQPDGGWLYVIDNPDGTG